MAVSTTTITSGSSSKLIINTDTDESADVGNGASCVIQQVEIDNTNNATTKTYLRLFNLSSTAGLSIGSAEPNMLLVAAGGTTATYVFPQGVTFNAGVVMAAVQEAGTAGSTGQSAAVTTRILLA